MNVGSEEGALWMKLSNIFVDTETDIAAMAKFVKRYPLEDIEFALFERVAPVCIYNVMASIPPVCWGSDEEMLVRDICAYVECRSRAGSFRRILSRIKIALNRWYYSDV